MRCSSGTYVRAIARDLGAALGVGGHLSALRRTAVGAFAIDTARTLDDLADACFFLLQNYDEEMFVNIGTGEDLTIKALAEMIKEIVGFEGELKWNTEKPDGTPRKLMDVSRLHNLGWKHRIELRDGITSVYAEFAKSELAKA